MLVDLRAICVFTPQNERLAHDICKQLRSCKILSLPHDYAFGNDCFPELYFNEVPGAVYLIITSKQCEKNQIFRTFVLKVLGEKKSLINIVLDATLSDLVEIDDINYKKIKYNDACIPQLAKLLGGEVSFNYTRRTIGTEDNISISSDFIQRNTNYNDTQLSSEDEVHTSPSNQCEELLTSKIKSEVSSEENAFQEALSPSNKLEQNIKEVALENDYDEIKSIEPIQEKERDNNTAEKVEDIEANRPYQKVTTEDGNFNKDSSDKEHDSVPITIDAPEDVNNDVYSDNNKSNHKINLKRKKILIFSIIFVLLIGLGVWLWNTYYLSKKEELKLSEAIDSEIRAQAALSENGDYIDNDEGREFPSIESSADAYDLYEDYLTDETLGDNWRLTDIVQCGIRDNIIQKLIKGSGYINGKMVCLEGVIFDDHRLYGRYYHSNGTKLDINGIEDRDGNLVIKLGHGSATSFLYLKFDYYEDVSNLYHFSGTCGRSNLGVDISCEFPDTDEIASQDNQFQQSDNSTSLLSSDESSQINSMGFHSGKNEFNAYMIHTDGRRFPFELSLVYNPDDSPQITNAIYVNPSSNTKVKLRIDEFEDGFIRLSGNTGGKAFVLEFRGTNPYTGDSWWGDFHQDVELSLK